MKKPNNRPNFLGAVKTLVRVTLNDSFRIRPRTEVSSLLIVQPAAKLQSPEPCPEPRVGTVPVGSGRATEVRASAAPQRVRL